MASKNTTTAVVPQSMDHEELMALLGQSGMLPTGGGGTFRRMSLKAGSLITDEGTALEEKWPPTRKGPTMTVRIVKPPIYYNAFFLSEKEENGSIDARIIGRPDMNGRFVKKYDDPAEQAADEWAHLDIYEQIAERTGKRGSFKADIQLQIVPENGEMTGDEPIYTLSLSTTSAMDFRGTSRNPEGGVVQDKNFIVQLAEFAKNQAIEAGQDKDGQAQAVLNAMTALRLGGVVADIYLITTSNDAGQDWTVVAFKPVHVEYGTQAPALESGDEPDNSDDLPF